MFAQKFKKIENGLASHPSNLKLHDFEILLFKLPNHFSHFI